MISKDYILDFLGAQNEILIDLNISLNNMMRLREDKYEFENKIKSHAFFQHHWYQLKFISVIQLSKLFSTRENDKRSFLKLCSTLETSPYDSSFTSHLEQNHKYGSVTAKSREDLLPIITSTKQTILDNNDIISKVLKARDSVYAHMDPNVSVEYTTPEEVKYLIILANKIYNDFEYNIFHATHLRDEFSAWNIDFLLKEMSKMKKHDNEERDRKIRRVK